MTTGQVTAYSKRYYYDHTGRLISETTQRTLYNTGTDYERIVYLYDESTMVGMDYTLNGSTARYYFQRNLQGDVTAIFSAQGLAVKYRYDAWGNCTVASETTNLNLARANPIRYRGYYYDHDTDLYFCNSRYYSPKWRRFVSPDTGTLNPNIVNGLNSHVYANNNPNLVCPKTQMHNSLPKDAYDALRRDLNSENPKSTKSNLLSLSVGLVTPQSANMPSWLAVYGFYVKGSLGWGHTFGEGYSLVSLGIGVLDATFHMPKLFSFLPDDHLANPNIFLGVGTWNANASIGLGISGTAEILSGTIGAQFGDSVSVGVKGYVGVGFTLDFTNGIRIGAGLGLGAEVFLTIDWYELFN